MDEPAFYNETPFFGGSYPTLDAAGRECRLAVVKGTWAIAPDGTLTLAEEPRPVRHGDEPWGPPEIPDVRFPGDLCPFKPGTDVVISGHACSEGGRRALAVDISIALAGRRKHLRVFGARRWIPGVFGPKISDPELLEPTPVSWGNAYGGFDASDPTKVLEEPRNPAGRGLARDTARLAGELVPSVEDPRDLLTGPSSRPPPVGCAPVGRNFVPRRTWAGTYDDHWLQEVYPARPSDYDPRHENCAPPDQVFETPWQGAEPVEISGMSTAGPLRFSVPKLRIVMTAVTGGREAEVRPHLDTVVVDTDVRVVELVWRGCFPLGSPATGLLEKIRVVMKAFA